MNDDMPPLNFAAKVFRKARPIENVYEHWKIAFVLRVAKEVKFPVWLI